MNRTVLTVITCLMYLNSFSQSMTKKELKKFSAVFNENYKAAGTHFKDQIDKSKRDEVLGMPSSKIPLPNNTRNYFDAATYSMTYVYSCENQEEATNLFKSIIKSVKSNLPDNSTISEENGYFSIGNSEAEGMNPTVEASVEETTVVIMFYPPLDISLPMDW